MTAWRSGSSIALFVTGFGSRSAASFDGSAQDAPLLRVEFTSAAAAGWALRLCTPGGTLRRDGRPAGQRRF
ncbi:MAG: hypothetical protein R2851_18450 [Caldilineaceae bacterium]